MHASTSESDPYNCIFPLLCNLHNRAQWAGYGRPRPRPRPHPHRHLLTKNPKLRHRKNKSLLQTSQSIPKSKNSSTSSSPILKSPPNLNPTLPPPHRLPPTRPPPPQHLGSLSRHRPATTKHPMLLSSTPCPNLFSRRKCPAAKPLTWPGPAMVSAGNSTRFTAMATCAPAASTGMISGFACVPELTRGISKPTW